MTTSKIKEINHIKPWNGDKGTIYYHNLVMENGDKINIGKAKEQQIGWELTYEITGDTQQEFRKAKAVQPEGGFDQQKGTYQKKSTGSTASFALSYAKDFCIEQISAGNNQTPNDVTAVADIFNQWLKTN